MRVDVHLSGCNEHHEEKKEEGHGNALRQKRLNSVLDARSGDLGVTYRP